MAKLNQDYNVDDMPQERTGLDPVPPAEYVSMVTASESKTTSKGGEMIVLQHTIQEGEFAGRIVFENLNIKNSNPQAEKMAFESLGELSHAVGLTGKLIDTEQLHNKRYRMVLSVKPAKPYDHTDPETGVVSKREGRAQNEVKKFLPMSAAASKPVSAKAATAAEKPATAPWKDKTKAAAKA